MSTGRARYTMICAEDGGVLDDLVVYRTGEQEFLVIANASNTPVVFEQLRARADGFDAAVADATGDWALIAIQGPAAASILAPLVLGADLAAMKYYAGAFGTVAGRRAWVARTGYTGEDGFEVYCAPSDAPHVWDALAAAGAPAGLIPAGLAARDTLRLEVGMPLYGNELGPDVTPFEAGLGRVVKFDKPGDFVGREALAARAAAGPRRRLVGLTVQSRRVARHGYPVLDDGQQAAGGSGATGGRGVPGGQSGPPRQVGTVTSGAPSPTLGVPIALAYLDADADAGSDAGSGGGSDGGAGKLDLAVGIRGEAVPAHLTDLPFYRRRQ
jgi:aminomethyltransferase